MKSLTQVLTIASLLVVLIAVASAFVPLEEDDLAAAQEMYMEYPELAQFFPGKILLKCLIPNQQKNTEEYAGKTIKSVDTLPLEFILHELKKMNNKREAL